MNDNHKRLQQRAIQAAEEALYKKQYVYPNKLKNWDFPDAVQAIFDPEKTDPLLDIGVVFSGSKMAGSVKGKTNSSACLGISPIDVFLGMGWLKPIQIDDWRKGRIPYLERVIQANLSKVSFTI